MQMVEEQGESRFFFFEHAADEFSIHRLVAQEDFCRLGPRPVDLVSADGLITIAEMEPDKPNQLIEIVVGRGFSQVRHGHTVPRFRAVEHFQFVRKTTPLRENFDWSQSRGVMGATRLGPRSATWSPPPDRGRVVVQDLRLRVCRRLGTVGSATTLALAGVLPFAAVVAGLAAAVTLAGVLPFARMLFRSLLVGLLVLRLILRVERRMRSRKKGGRLNGGIRTGEQARQRSGNSKNFSALGH